MKKGKKKIKQLNRIYDEYKYRESLTKKSFTNLYTNLNISIAFYGTIIAFILNNEDINIFVFYSFLFLLLPVFTYIFGLLFCYNLFVITKGGCITITLENRIREMQITLYKTSDFVGWGITEKRKNLGRILVYGTILMFYILLPILSIFWGIINIIKTGQDALSIFLISISVILYTIYIIFMIIILIDSNFALE